MINRAKLRGKSLDADCKRANISRQEYGEKDDRLFCFGLYGDMNDDIQLKCSRCKAYVGNAEPLKAGEENEHEVI